MVELGAVTNVTPDQVTGFVTTNFSLVEFIEVIKPLVIFIIAIALFAIFIFKFYKSISKRDLIDYNFDKYTKGSSKFIKILVHGLQTNVLAPIAIFFWLIVFTTFLILLADTYSPETILLTSMAIVGAIRITAYYTQDLSQDVAKLLPFAMLAIILFDVSKFSVDKIITIGMQMPSIWKNFTYYFVFVVGLEFVLRTAKSIYDLVRKDNEEEPEED